MGNISSAFLKNNNKYKNDLMQQVLQAKKEKAAIEAAKKSNYIATMLGQTDNAKYIAAIGNNNAQNHINEPEDKQNGVDVKNVLLALDTIYSKYIKYKGICGLIYIKDLKDLLCNCGNMNRRDYTFSHNNVLKQVTALICVYNYLFSEEELLVIYYALFLMTTNIRKVSKDGLETFKY